MEPRVVAKYKSPEGAASFNTKYEREWHKRVSTRWEYGVIRKCFKIAGPQETILDLPSGTGRLFRAYQPFGKSFFGMDLSHEMLKFARSNVAEWSSRLSVASAFQMPLRDGAVDCVFSARLFHHVPDRGERHRYIREMCRVARKWVVFTFFHTWSVKNLLRMIRRPFNRKKPKVTMTTGELREVARSAGWEVVTTYPLARLVSGHHYAVLRRCSSTA
jgi:ubiquinone/menaquinone biosynthesis C-methylase UbiE